MTVSLLISACLVTYVMVSTQADSFQNFTIEWEDFSVLTCAVPKFYNALWFNCLSGPRYTIVEDFSCLVETVIIFDGHSCESTMTTSTTTTTIGITTTITSQQTSVTTAAGSSVPAATTMTATITTSPSTTGSTESSTVTRVQNQSTTTPSQSQTSAQTSSPTTITSGSSTDSTSINSQPGTTITTSSVTSSAITTVSTSEISSPSTVQSTSTSTTTASISNTSYAEFRCSNGNIGTTCNISVDPCLMAQPCENAATCFPNNSLPFGYYCLCQSGFDGYNCENDHRPCREDTCWHNGTCIPSDEIIAQSNGSQFTCICIDGYNGMHCELKADYCGNITCYNGGICQTVDLQWKCQCTDSNLYYGDYCELKTTVLRIREILSRSFATVAIGAIVTTCSFIVIMDVLKYAFLIDPVEAERDTYRKRCERLRRARRPPPINGANIAIRFQYVN